MSKPLTKPCKRCPWRKDSAAGWLGASSPTEFVLSTLQEAHMPCHCTINYEDPFWRKNQLPDAPLCAGGLAFLKNAAKLPRDRELAAAMEGITGHDEVFKTPQEFIDYHTNGVPHDY